MAKKFIDGRTDEDWALAVANNYDANNNDDIDPYLS